MGPLRHAQGLEDYEGLGRERWHDMRPDQRDEHRSSFASMAHPSKAMGGPRPGPEGEYAFARGWLDEERRNNETAGMNNA